MIMCSEISLVCIVWKNIIVLVCQEIRSCKVYCFNIAIKPEDAGELNIALDECHLVCITLNKH